MSPDIFIRKVYHDLRAPLRALKELPTWLEEDLDTSGLGVPDTARDLLEMMKTQSIRMEKIVAGLYELAKLERREAAPLTDAAALGSAGHWAERADCRIDVSEVPMEEQHLELAVRHLIDNAHKHAGGGTERAALTISETADGVIIAVTDSGPGIDPRYVDTVYEPLTTLKSRDECEGSGMGLAVVAKIAGLYGGSCYITQNAWGRGVTSSLTVPVRQAPVIDVADLLDVPS